MSDVSAVLRYFSTINEGFSTTLGSIIVSGASTVPLNSTAGLTNGSVFVGIIEPGAAKQQVFTGTVDTGTSSITAVKWTRGTNTGHAAGVAIVDYVTGTDWNMMSKGVLVEHNQDGTHNNVHATSVTTGAFTATGAVAVPNNTQFVVPANLLAGTGTDWVWKSYTPVFGNIVMGNSVINYAKYMQIGKTVHVRVGFTYGSTSDIVGGQVGISMTLPVASASDYLGYHPLGLVNYHEAGVTIRMGSAYWSGTSSVELIAWKGNADSIYRYQWTTTSPVETKANDQIFVTLTYEAA